jgi:hypothetical protein
MKRKSILTAIYDVRKKFGTMLMQFKVKLNDEETLNGAGLKQA